MNNSGFLLHLGEGGPRRVGHSSEVPIKHPWEWRLGLYDRNSVTEPGLFSACDIVSCSLRRILLRSKGNGVCVIFHHGNRAVLKLLRAMRLAERAEFNPLEISHVATSQS